MKLILISVSLLIISFGLISIKLLFKKNGKFEGTCASNNPLFSNKDGSCGYCGAKKNEICS